MPPADSKTNQPRDPIPLWLWVVGVGSIIYTAALITTGVKQDWWTKRWTTANIAESCRRGDEIVAGLEAYRADRGYYPKSLQALVPLYMPSIPKATAGRTRWNYDWGSDQSFSLSFSSRNGENSIQRSAADSEWRSQSEFYESSGGRGERDY
jgi:hypothetical protein